VTHMPGAEMIADMIVQEALSRKSNLDICARIHEVRMEVMLVIMDVSAGIREAERNEKGGHDGSE